MKPEDLVALQETFGDPLLRYLLAVEESAGRPLEDVHLSGAERGSVISMLLALLESGMPEGDLQRQFGLSSWLTHRAPGAALTVAQTLRSLSGGDLPAPSPTKDPVLRGLLGLLHDGYPSLLLPARPGPFWFGPRVGVAFDDPNRRTLEAEVLADPILRALFPSHVEGSGWMGQMRRSSGSGGTVQLAMFPEQQITMAWEQARLHTATPTLQQVAAVMKANLRTVRHVVSGKKTSVPVLAALAGVLLPEGADLVDLGFAKLRRATEGDRSLGARTGIQGKLQATTPEGQSVVIDYAGDVVLEMSVPYEVMIGTWDPGSEASLTSPWPDSFLKARESLNGALETLRLALVLALDTPTPVNVVPSWQVHLDPLGSTLSAGWSDTRQVPNLVPTQLTETQAIEWFEWIQRVHTRRTPSISVAIRRLLQAIAERRNPEDVLVDAVIVWENLFGASVEAVLRVTSSMAWLLAADAEDRAVKQKEFKALYGTRSGIVHGHTSKARMANLSEQAQRAVDVSRSALRAIFRDRPDLLAIKSSEERSLAMLLGHKPA